MMPIPGEPTVKGKRGTPRKHPADTKPKKLTRQEQILKINMAGMAHREEMQLAKQAKDVPKTTKGLTARELQEMRNAEYFRKVAEGKIKDPPFPNVLNRLVLRDDDLGEPL